MVARYTPDWGQDDGEEELIGAVGPVREQLRSFTMRVITLENN
jgi:hypothetical protein